MDVFEAFEKSMKNSPSGIREIFYAGFACGASNTGTIWQQRGPWFITTFVGGLIGYGISFLAHTPLPPTPTV